MNMKRFGIFAPLAVLLVIANLVLLNMWSSRLFGRLDLTDTKVYTLSDVTKDIIRELDEPLTIKAYFTKDLPAPYNNVARFVEDQLAEMKAFGGGNFRYEFLDPQDEETLKKEAESFRIEPIQVNEYRQDKVQFKLAYLGMVLIYQDRQEVIPVVQSLENIEYDIVGKIRRITTDKTPTIGFLGGHGEPGLRENMGQLDSELRKMYDLKPVNLAARSGVPDDIDLLCIIGPKEDIPEAEQFMIDQYLMSGGKIFWALNMVDADISQMQAQKSALRINPMLENYGIKLTDQLVLDKSAPTLPFQTMTRYGRQITMVTYPFFPEVINFNRELAPMGVMRNIRYYFPSVFDTTIAAGMDSVDVTPLMYSSNKSSLMAAPYDINPLTARNMNDYNQGPFALGAVVSGKFDSFWKDKEIPKAEDGTPVSEDPIIPKSPETRMIVLGDANFVQDQFVVPGLDNMVMALNIIDWMVQDERLIEIRSRDVSSRPITEVSDAARRTIKYINMIVPSLLIIIFGLIRWQMRLARRRKQVIPSQSTRIGGGE